MTFQDFARSFFGPRAKLVKIPICHVEMVALLDGDRVTRDDDHLSFDVDTDSPFAIRVMLNKSCPDVLRDPHFELRLLDSIQLEDGDFVVVVGDLSTKAT